MIMRYLDPRREPALDCARGVRVKSLGRQGPITKCRVRNLDRVPTGDTRKLNRNIQALYCSITGLFRFSGVCSGLG